MHPKIRAVVFNCLVLTTLFSILGAIIIPVTVALGLGLFHDWDPKGYEIFVSGVLGISEVKQVSLTESDALNVSAQGIDPDKLANALEATNWIRDQFSTESVVVNIDVGILLSIIEHESANGTNMGNCKGTQAWKSNMGLVNYPQDGHINWLLSYWRDHNVRTLSSVSSRYIESDYSDYISHCSSSEVGPFGLLPETAVKICRDGMALVPDSFIQACPFWDERAGAYAAAYWLYALDYFAELSYEQKFDELRGWNQNVPYRYALLDRAIEINNALNGVISSETQILSFFSFSTPPSNDTRTGLAEILQNWGLLPDSLVQNQYYGDFKGIPVASAAGGESYRGWGVVDGYVGDAGHHQGLDFACDTGDPIFAVADGVVANPSNYAYKNDPRGWGLALWIDHGGIFSFYGHMSGLNVEYGSSVKTGDVIGFCGSTGNSTGSHLHFGVSTIHPDGFSLWYQENPGWVDPSPYLTGWADEQPAVESTEDK